MVRWACWPCPSGSQGTERIIERTDATTVERRMKVVDVEEYRSWRSWWRCYFSELSRAQNPRPHGAHRLCHWYRPTVMTGQTTRCNNSSSGTISPYWLMSTTVDPPPITALLKIVIRTIESPSNSAIARTSNQFFAIELRTWYSRAWSQELHSFSVPNSSKSILVIRAIRHSCRPVVSG